MIYHVLPGDSVAGVFKSTNIAGEMIVCREAFIAGPINADTPLDFWDERAKFILAEYGEDEIVYHETVADGLAKLADLSSHDDLHLWFEYELFCSVNLWFCIAMAKDSGCPVYRVEPVVNSFEDRWKGFGSVGPDELKKCFEKRIRLTSDDIELGSELWDAFRKDDNIRLAELANVASRAFPYLKEVCDAAVERSFRPEHLLREIMDSGVHEFIDIFAEFSRRAGVYGYGDLQVKRLVDQVSL